MRYLPVMLAFATLASTSAQAVLPFSVSLESEKPGMQTSTSGFNFVGVETFRGTKTGNGQTFKTDFGSGGQFAGVYSNVQINDNDQYGGAGGLGQYAVTFEKAGYSLDLASKTPGDITYFGFWLSALDGNNSVSFFQGGKQLFTFSAKDAKAFIDKLPNSKSYYCNPNKAYASKNCGEPYAFLNFYAEAGTRFDQVVFNQLGGGGYESDNHTVGQWSKKSGTVIVSGVPEPQTWAILMAGFSLVGISMRRRDRAVAA